MQSQYPPLKPRKKQNPDIRMQKQIAQSLKTTSNNIVYDKSLI